MAVRKYTVSNMEAMNIPESEGYDDGMRGSTIVQFPLLQAGLANAILV
jgi:hypothetical protein